MEKKVYKIDRNPMQKFVIDKFRTYNNFAKAVGVSIPTARSYMEKPFQMTVGSFSRVCVACDCTAVELFEVMKQTAEVTNDK